VPLQADELHDANAAATARVAQQVLLGIMACTSPALPGTQPQACLLVSIFHALLRAAAAAAAAAVLAVVLLLLRCC
jgi:hypothetical protein